MEWPAKLGRRNPARGTLQRVRLDARVPWHLRPFARPSKTANQAPAQAALQLPAAPPLRSGLANGPGQASGGSQRATG